jgi:hypothetical protein
MKNIKNLLLTALAIGSVALTGCLHIIEEVTFKEKGNGHYAMTIDMSELKSMMDMLKAIAPDSTDSETPDPEAEENSVPELGKEIGDLAYALKSVEGISNVKPLNDTSTYRFGYSFDFASVAALNRALEAINKEKGGIGHVSDFQSKSAAKEFFKFDSKTFTRLPNGDMGAEMKEAMMEDDEETDEETKEMMLMMFAEMTYKQIYHFPDNEIKKSSNELTELSDNNRTMTIVLKPFNEEQSAKKASVAAEVKLK